MIARLAIIGLSIALLTVLAPSFSQPACAQASEIDSAVRARFARLAENGNSNCSVQFQQSIAELPGSARLQGSCCGPMDLHRYAEQTEGLRQFGAIPAIPADPYDIEAPKAQLAMAAYNLELTLEEQASYDDAMENSHEGGPCCCRCWRWRVYGGLAKLLIREHGFTGWQIAALWDLSDGCGGAHERS